MGFQWSSKQVKMVSLFYDALYMLCGLIAIVLGGKIISSLHDTSTQPHSTVHSLATALIIFGVIIILVSIIGSLAVIKHSERGLIVFGIILGVLIALKIIVAIIVLSYMNDVIQVTRNEITRIFNDGEYAKDQIDSIQRAYECCGLNGPSFWREDLLPPTCCPDEKFTCSTENDAYLVGCNDKVASSVEGMGTTIGLVLFGIAFFEVAGLILSVCLKSTWTNERNRADFEHTSYTHG